MCMIWKMMREAEKLNGVEDDNRGGGGAVGLGW